MYVKICFTKLYGKLHFVINLGDIVDGNCPKDQSLEAVKKTVMEFEKFNGPVYHLVGNHCLYNLPREKLLPLLKIPSPNKCAYYDFSPVKEYRVVVLDGYDVSAIGWPVDHPATQKAIKLLYEKNPNSNQNSPEGLEGTERRFVKFNGAVGREQMRWLDCVLHDATKLKQKVISCSHMPLHPGPWGDDSLLWNYEEVMAVMHKYKCVKVCLSGHDHQGGHTIDNHGIHHRSLEAPLESPPGTNAFGCIHVYENGLFLSGVDRMQSTDMQFNN